MDDRPKNATDQIIEAVESMGVDVKNSVAEEWLENASAASDSLAAGDAGVFGHRTVLIDFAVEDVERYRKLAEVVGIPSRENVDTAIALAGSSAQSRAQLFPGDCDLFERVNIRAATREEAVSTLADLIIENVEAVMRHESFQLTEVKLGSYQEALLRGDETVKVGSPISWNYGDLSVRQIQARRADGDLVAITLTSAAEQPGFTKIDWVVADAQTGRVMNTSKVLDVTWEATDGHIEPLDGAIDPYYQEVYLRQDSMGTVRRLIDNLSPDSLREYVQELEGEVVRYGFDHANYGKVAKRLYNIYRVLGRYEEALFVRELFDEPPAKLYQVAAVLEAIGRDLEDGRPLSSAGLQAELAGMRQTVEQTVAGEKREQMLALLDELDASAEGSGPQGEELWRVVNAAKDVATDTVNLFFQGHLVSNPKIWSYVESLRPQ